MKKLIITMVAGLLMAGGLWAEQKVCDINNVKPGTYIDIYLKDCKSGDILQWRFETKYGDLQGQGLIASACHQEKQITTKDNFATGVCTYTGKVLGIRVREVEGFRE